MLGCAVAPPVLHVPGDQERTAGHCDDALTNGSPEGVSPPGANENEKAAPEQRSRCNATCALGTEKRTNDYGYNKNKKRWVYPGIHGLKRGPQRKE